MSSLSSDAWAHTDVSTTAASPTTPKRKAKVNEKKQDHKEGIKGSKGKSVVKSAKAKAKGKLAMRLGLQDAPSKAEVEPGPAEETFSPAKRRRIKAKSAPECLDGKLLPSSQPSAQHAQKVQMWPWMGDLPGHLLAGHDKARIDSGVAQSMPSTGETAQAETTAGGKIDVLAEQSGQNAESGKKESVHVAFQRAAGASGSSPGTDSVRRGGLSKQSGFPGVSWQPSLFAWKVQYKQPSAEQGKQKKCSVLFPVAKYRRPGCTEEEAVDVALQAALDARRDLIAKGIIKDSVRRTPKCNREPKRNADNEMSHAAESTSGEEMNELAEQSGQIAEGGKKDAVHAASQHATGAGGSSPGTDSARRAGLSKQSGLSGVHWSSSLSAWIVQYKQPSAKEGSQKSYSISLPVAKYRRPGCSEDEADKAALQAAESYKNELIKQGLIKEKKKQVCQVPKENAGTTRGDLMAHASNVTGVYWSQADACWHAPVLVNGKVQQRRFKYTGPLLDGAHESQIADSGKKDQVHAASQHATSAGGSSPGTDLARRAGLSKQSGLSGVHWSSSLSAWIVQYKQPSAKEGSQKSYRINFPVAKYRRPGCTEDEADEAALQAAKSYRNELIKKGTIKEKTKQACKSHSESDGTTQGATLAHKKQNDLAAHVSGVPGVSWRPAEQCWLAQITISGKKLNRRYRPEENTFEGLEGARQLAEAWLREQAQVKVTKQ
eukprot:TRINITY_DN7589_c0_g1_i1.p1 TRINITY_DN7589_c0_g1~~TRINITY_DN7589_c0_g1_i1.p1  ORF type:complete len:717 (-),score=165.22 TRINITY_DN7589_c0_g1_i1:91-2241(-)